MQLFAPHKDRDFFWLGVVALHQQSYDME
jgi:hypothetical protein